jgi:hypothetical protein
MSKLLEEAMARAAMLPEADQEKIGRDLLSHVEKLRLLRTELEKGIRSLERGEGKDLNIEDFICRAEARIGRA